MLLTKTFIDRSSYCLSSSLIASNNSPNTIFQLNNKELLPVLWVIAKFTLVSACDLPHHQCWLLLYNGTMHVSLTLEHIIKKLYMDIDATLVVQRPLHDCPIIICCMNKLTITAYCKENL